MKKNPFKKQGIIDTVVNVGVGGAANVAIDYVVSSVDALSGLSATVINAAKIAVGAIGGTMTTNKYVRAAVDGIAVVGASNLVSSLMDGTASEEAAAGLPQGTIGRVRLGNRRYRRHVAGVNATPSSFMGK